MAVSASADATRERLLEATRTALARYGPRKIALTDIARLAGVSRPTLYKYFPSKEALLEALAGREHRRFDEALVAAVHGYEGEARIDAALRFMVEYQADDPIRHLVPVEPGFVLEQVSVFIGITRTRMCRLFEDLHHDWVLPHGASPEDLADTLVRTALSHFLIPSPDAGQLLRELRIVAGVSTLAQT